MSGADYSGIVLLNYRLTEKLGEGGFGAVYLAVHEELGRRAAVKILHPEFARHREVVDRFFREAKAVCAIGHPCIVDVTNFGRLPSGEPFYMMDFVAGKSLSAVITARRLQPSELPGVFEPVASALAAAHEKHIVHRDLKPDNIMLVERPSGLEVKLLDFGIAKLMDSEDNVASRTGSAMGTPSYMAPEQGRDAKSVDTRADVYGFAATVFATLTGRPPFLGQSATEILIAVATQPPPKLRTLVPGAPAKLEAALARCLEKDPAARPQSIWEAWGLIREAAGGVRVGSSGGWPTAVGVGPLPPSQTTLSSAGAEMAPRETAPRRSLWAGLGAAVLVAAGLTYYFAVYRPAQGDESAGGGSASPEATVSPSPEVTIAPSPSPEVTIAPSPTVAVVEPSPEPSAAPSPEPTPVAIASPAPSPAEPRSKLECSPSSFDQIGELGRLEKCKKAAQITKKAYADVRARLVPRVAAPPPPSPTPTAAAAPSPTPAPVRDECSRSSFDRTAKASSPPESEVRAALRRLNECVAEGKMSASTAAGIRDILISKL